MGERRVAPCVKRWRKPLRAVLSAVRESVISEFRGRDADEEACREIGNGDERPTGAVREWCCKRVKTTGATKRTYRATREGKGPVAGVALGVRVVSGSDPNTRGGKGVPEGKARKRRDREREVSGGGSKAGRGGGIGERRGENCELASDVAFPFLGFTSFIRRAAGSSRAVELQFLLFLLWNTQWIRTMLP